ncbi:hypothetical protein PR202_gb05954 [Eleusine coracana subsp. coracana]|uniref:Uncharacterized protein n=1 Tax=Eleusine coracana subsp. coracana TaxID=191504 RepID=A0AAV5E8M6_ELECO|nr:hypothetical protein PR202_gb05954 [Eleusine coracana subsp. coracana]
MPGARGGAKIWVGQRAAAPGARGRGSGRGSGRDLVAGATVEERWTRQRRRNKRVRKRRWRAGVEASGQRVAAGRSSAHGAESSFPTSRRQPVAPPVKSSSIHGTRRHRAKPAHPLPIGRLADPRSSHFFLTSGCGRRSSWCRAKKSEGSWAGSELTT